MTRHRNKSIEKPQYKDGDIVWVKMHNSEIWWPGEVTKSEDFRFVNATRKPFAVVAFFNEKSFEQIQSPTMIFHFQCSKKNEFVAHGKKKTKGPHNAKFVEDVKVAEARCQEQAAQPSVSRQDTLIKALVSNSDNNFRAPCAPPPTPPKPKESTIRIMDLGNSSQSERTNERIYQCDSCNFYTSTMSVYLIHRNTHCDSSDRQDSNSSHPMRARRANTTSILSPEFVCRTHKSSIQHQNMSPTINSGLRQQRLSIVVEGMLTDEQTQTVENIMRYARDSIESIPQLTPAKLADRSTNRSRRRGEQLRTTMPAPLSAPKQRRLTRSMSRLRTAAESNEDSSSSSSSSPPLPSAAAVAAVTLPPPATVPRASRPLPEDRRKTMETAQMAKSVVLTDITPPCTKRGSGKRKTLTAISPQRTESFCTSTTAPVNNAPMFKTTTTKKESTATSISVTLTSTAVAEPNVESDKVAAEPNKTAKKRQASTSRASTDSVKKTKVAASELNLVELQQSLLAEWCEDDVDDLPIVGSEQEQQRLPNGSSNNKTSNKELDEDANKQQQRRSGSDSSNTLRKKIRNIPKKDHRRDVALQEFDAALSAATTEAKPAAELIVIQDSDASSNESVVFVEAEPKQQRSGGTNTTINNSLTKGANNNSSSCFDFEEHEVELGQNGLSYRRRFKQQIPSETMEQQQQKQLTNGQLNKESQQETAEPEAAAEPDDALEEEEATPTSSFKGFEENEVLTATTADLKHPETETDPLPELVSQPETESQLEPEPETEPDQSCLPIKERQKRIFKSRNKSVPNADVSVHSITLPQEPTTATEKSPTNMPTVAASNDSKTQISPNSTPAANGKRKLAKKSSERRLRRNHRDKRPLEQKLVMQRAQSALSSELEEIKGNDSNSWCAPGSVLDSPTHSSSTSCSIASNIAVISAEEARELQRSSSAASASSSQPAALEETGGVTSCGIQILEDIRLPNYYDRSFSVGWTNSQDSNSKLTNSSQTTTSDATQFNADDHKSEEAEEEEESEQQQAEQPPQLDNELPLAAAEEQPTNDEDENMSQEEKWEQQEWQRRQEIEESQRCAPREELRKRERELLRKYEEDLKSGRSAEICRKARERWQRDRPAFDSSYPDSSSTTVVNTVLPKKMIGPFRTSSQIQKRAQSEQSSLEKNETKKPLVRLTDLSHEYVMKAQEQFDSLQQKQRENMGQNRGASLCLSTTKEEIKIKKKRSRQSISDDIRLCQSEDFDDSRQMTLEETDEAQPQQQLETQQQQQLEQFPENPPAIAEMQPHHANAGPICAVSTKPIAGYPQPFFLCSLSNNRFTPIDHVPLYLDAEKNHLVPVPTHAITEPPMLEDDNALSAVYTNIDFVRGGAVPQVFEVGNQDDDEDDIVANAADISDIIEPLDNAALADVAGADYYAGNGVNLNNICDDIEPEDEANNDDDDNVQEEPGGDCVQALQQEQPPTNNIVLFVRGYQLALDLTELISIAQQPSDIQVRLNDHQIVLEGREIVQAAREYFLDQHVQLCNEDGLPIEEDLLAEILAGGDDNVSSAFMAAAHAGVSMLHDDVDATDGAMLVGGDNADDDDDVDMIGNDNEDSNESASGVYISQALPAAHLTPPIPARTNETNTLLNQTPIMSTLECPSSVGGRRVSPLTESNLDDSLAVIGVGVPTSLELPITITNPAIAPRASTAASDLVQFTTFQ